MVWSIVARPRHRVSGWDDLKPRLISMTSPGKCSNGGVRRSTVSAGLARRACIVLEAATGATNVEVADRLGCSTATVAKWRSRFLASGLVGLSDEYRSGRPRTISDDQVEAVIVATLGEKPPDEATHWSTRTMAHKAGLSQSAISRRLAPKAHLDAANRLSAVATRRPVNRCRTRH